MEKPYLVCEVHSSYWAIPIVHVAETLRPLAVEPLAGVAPFVRGLALIRGETVPVIDAAALHGIELPDAPTRFVVLRSDARGIALAVTGVPAIRNIDDETVAEMPSVARAPGAAALSDVGTLDAKLLFVLEAIHLISDSEWKAIEAAVTS